MALPNLIVRGLVSAALAGWVAVSPAWPSDTCATGTPCPSHSAVAALAPEHQQNHVFFPNGGTNLDADARAQIAQLAKVMSTTALDGSCFKLVGHSDSSGSVSRNLTISRERAQAVSVALQNMVPGLGGSETRVLVDAMGEDAPLDGIDPANPAQRRVAIYAKRCT